MPRLPIFIAIEISWYMSSIYQEISIAMLIGSRGSCDLTPKQKFSIFPSRSELVLYSLSLRFSVNNSKLLRCLPGYGIFHIFHYLSDIFHILANVKMANFTAKSFTLLISRSCSFLDH